MRRMAETDSATATMTAGDGPAGIALWAPVEFMHSVLPWFGVHLGPHHGIGWMDWLSFATATVAIVFIGGAFYRSAWRALVRRTSNMDTLISMGASVAYVYSLVALVGYLAGAWHHLPDLYFMESAGLLALISLGHWLEARARDSAGSAIRELLNLAPATALRIPVGATPASASSGSEEGDTTVAPTSAATPAEVPVADLRIGDLVLVRP